MSKFGGLTVRGTSAKRAVIKLPTFGYQVITHTEAVSQILPRPEGEKKLCNRSGASVLP